MKRFIPLIAVLLVVSLFAAGCSGEAESVTIEVGNTDAASATAQSSSGPTTVIGRVDSIVGNEVTLSIGTLDSSGTASSRTDQTSGRDFAAGSATSGRFGGASSSDMPGGATPGDFASGSNMPPQGGASGSNMPQGASGSDMRGGFGNGGTAPGNLASNGNMPGGASGTNMPQGASGSSVSGGAEGRSMGGAMNITYTGETATYLLPVGMAIGTGDYSSVSEGMVLQLTIDNDGTITAVSILSR